MAAITISNLAKSAGVPASTVRFYERQGIILPAGRSRANYRTYTPAAVERLRFVRAAQASGFSLKDVRQMLELTRRDGSPCDGVEALIRRRLVEVREKLKELRKVERTLDAALKSCCRGGTDWCGQIERLRVRPAD